MYWALLGKRALLQRTVKQRALLERTVKQRALLERTVKHAHRPLLERTVKQRARFTETLVGVYWFSKPCHVGGDTNLGDERVGLHSHGDASPWQLCSGETVRRLVY